MKSYYSFECCKERISRNLKNFWKYRKYKKKTVSLDDIRIQKIFAIHIPRKEKFMRKLKYYWKYGICESPIVVNKDMELIDGYITYLILQNYSSKLYVKVIVKDD